MNTLDASHIPEVFAILTVRRATRGKAHHLSDRRFRHFMTRTYP